MNLTNAELLINKDENGWVMDGKRRVAEYNNWQ